MSVLQKSRSDKSDPGNLVTATIPDLAEALEDAVRDAALDGNSFDDPDPIFGGPDITSPSGTLEGGIGGGIGLKYKLGWCHYWHLKTICDKCPKPPPPPPKPPSRKELEQMIDRFCEGQCFDIVASYVMHGEDPPSQVQQQFRRCMDTCIHTARF